MKKKKNEKHIFTLINNHLFELAITFNKNKLVEKKKKANNIIIRTICQITWTILWGTSTGEKYHIYHIYKYKYKWMSVMGVNKICRLRVKRAWAHSSHIDNVRLSRYEISSGLFSLYSFHFLQYIYIYIINTHKSPVYCRHTSKSDIPASTCPTAAAATTTPITLCFRLRYSPWTFHQIIL